MISGITDSHASPVGLAFEGVHPVFSDGSVELVREFKESLAQLDGRLSSDAERIDLIGELEEIKAAAAATQARVTVAFEASQLAVQQARGVSARNRGRGIADQVALARGCPASQGARHLGFGKAIVNEMPHTHGLLTTGAISEWVATLLVKETAILSLEDRRLVDERLCAMTVDAATGEVHPPVVIGQTPRRVEGMARSLAHQLDPEAAVRAASRQAKHRRVSLRPAPDTMSYLTGHVPVAQGVACWAALDNAAKAIKSAGDERSLDQIRADLLVERLTGQATADAVSAEICVTIPADALAGATEAPGRTDDGTPLPAALIRDLANRPDAPAWLRRMVTDPITGESIHLDKRRRRFTSGDARFITARDQHCRHPRCDGPIAHKDHVVSVARGGETTEANAQGLCEAHNYVKEAPGWSAAVMDPRPGRHTVQITTPTGHTYRSNAPPAVPPRL